MNSVTRMTSLWFGPRMRMMATAFVLGGFHIGMYVVNWAKRVMPEDEKLSLNTFSVAMIGINIFLTLVAVFFFKAEPEDTSSES